VTVADPDPAGAYDAARSPEGDQVAVVGWAFDPNAKTSPVVIHVYIGGPAGAPDAEGDNIGEASSYRADVGRAYPGVGDYHGYATAIQTTKRGAQQVCAYEINVGPGEDIGLGCKTVTIGEPLPVAAPAPETSPSPRRVRRRRPKAPVYPPRPFEAGASG
jgi:hypothetical protein